MKPRLFIGSSSENLEIAYDLQQNLDGDALVTVWTQNVFNLTNNTLDDLLVALDNFDFAMFVFRPDDITKIRNQSVETVRDNVIFELGLFIGRLGKGKVFILIPKSVRTLRLPTDLIGINPGIYNDEREDGNRLASLAVFCNKVRNYLKQFVYEHTIGIENEPVEIKRIAINKKGNWGIILATSMLLNKMKPINRNYEDLRKGYVINRVKVISSKEFLAWIGEYLANVINYNSKFQVCLNDFTHVAILPDENPDKVLEIRYSVERIITLCNQIFLMENDLYSLRPEKELIHIKEQLLDQAKILIVDVVNDLAKTTLERILQHDDETNDYVYELYNPKFIIPIGLSTLNDEIKKLNLEYL